MSTNLITPSWFASRKKTWARCASALVALVIFSVSCIAQTPAKDLSASISGRITIGGKGAAGIAVAATTSSSPLDNRTVAKATTDDDGNYRLTGLAAGKFTIMPMAKAFVVGTAGAFKPPGQSITVAESESITKIDFALIRGGVITGRITDSEGRPVIGERVNVVTKDTPKAGTQMTMFDGPRNLTDDRGVYRIYGLGPGSYKVGVGQALASGGVSIMGMGASQYPETFYPGAQDESRATNIEINEGTEVLNIDIVVGKSGGGFSVSGRVIDADSGQPVPDAYIAYSSLSDANQQMGGMSFTGNKSDVNGKFRLEGIRPGRYAAFTMGIGQETSTYSDPAPFEVAEGDVSGIEIKLRRGATLSGVVAIENNFDPAVAAMLQTLSLYAFVKTKGTGAPSFSRGKIGPDGSIVFSGLAPGKVQITLAGFPTPPKELTLVRTEVDGLDQREGIEVTAGAQITGLRLVFSYGTGSVRGEVKIEGGVLPAGTTLTLSVRSGAGDTHAFNRYVEVDARGHFVAENLPPGAYELSLHAVGADRKPVPAFEPLTKTVTVANGEVQVILVVNLAAKKVGPE
jgi:protocatechuate 3,4-dioxygenase beta subunit